MFFNQFLDRKKTKNLSTSTNISINDTRNISECTPINNNKNIQKININNKDTYFEDAARLLIGKEKGSIGILQRNLNIGFNRASHIMDQLEEAGIVDSEEGTAPRRILMSLNEFETYEFISTNGQEQQNNIDVVNTLSDADMLLIYLNIIANFSNDGQQLSKLDHYIIYKCTEADQHNIINQLLTYNSSKTMKLVIYDENALSYGDYSSLSQLFIPIVSDHLKIETTIDLLKNEMTERFHKFAEIQVKDLYSYNSKATNIIPSIIFIISEIYLVKSYFIENIDLIQLLLNSKKAGIYLFMFSQFDIKHFSLGIMQDLFKVCDSRQALHMIYPEKNSMLQINNTSILKSIDNMNGKQFENYCADLLQYNNFSNIEITQASGDHGVDILAEKDSITYAIQCKCYSSNIGNAAIQQIHSGKSLYHKDVAVVLTNQYFTTQARKEANALNVKLWDRDKLYEMIKNIT